MPDVYTITNKIDNKIYLECSCHSVNHLIVLEYDPDHPGVYIYAHLRPIEGRWKRFKEAFRYIFSKEPYHCSHDEIILNLDSCKDIKRLVEKFETDADNLAVRLDIDRDHRRKVTNART